MTDINFQMVYDSLMYGMPGFIFLLFVSFLIFLSMHLGKWHSDKMWKNNIKFHMPKVTKEEINTRDAEIKKLTEELEKSKEENNRLNAACTAMKNIADVMKPVEEAVKTEPVKKKGGGK